MNHQWMILLIECQAKCQIDSKINLNFAGILVDLLQLNPFSFLLLFT